MESNHQPRLYESLALPLSHIGMLILDYINFYRIVNLAKELEDLSKFLLRAFFESQATVFGI